MDAGPLKLNPGPLGLDPEPLGLGAGTISLARPLGVDLSSLELDPAGPDPGLLRFDPGPDPDPDPLTGPGPDPGPALGPRPASELGFGRHTRITLLKVAVASPTAWMQKQTARHEGAGRICWLSAAAAGLVQHDMPQTAHWMPPVHVNTP